MISNETRMPDAPGQCVHAVFVFICAFRNDRYEEVIMYHYNVLLLCVASRGTVCWEKRDIL